jgi:hypothetical protein
LTPTPCALRGPMVWAAEARRVPGKWPLVRSSQLASIRNASERARQRLALLLAHLTWMSHAYIVNRRLAILRD